MLIYILLLACITRRENGKEIESIAAEMLVVLYMIFCYIYKYIYIYTYIYICRSITIIRCSDCNLQWMPICRDACEKLTRFSDNMLSKLREKIDFIERAMNSFVNKFISS